MGRDMKKKPVRRLTVYSPEALTATIGHPKGDVFIDLNGIPSKTFAELALRGAVSLCKGRSDPHRRAALIREGNLSGKPLRPPNRNHQIMGIIMGGKTVLEGKDKWESLSPAQRRKLRKTGIWKKAEASLIDTNWDELKELLEPGA